MPIAPLTRLLCIVPIVFSLMLTACGGSGSGDELSSANQAATLTPPTPPSSSSSSVASSASSQLTTTYTIGGTVSGLNGTVVLQNNGTGDLTISSANGSFTFSGNVSSGTIYVVTVFTQPASQACTVSNSSGTATANVTNVVVTCTNSIASSSNWDELIFDRDKWG